MNILPLHLDCDTGQDDAIALLYALGSPSLDIKSISVACGNVDVYQSARNTLQILELAGFPSIPVYIGAEKPLERPLESLPEVFGITGMAGAEDWPQPHIKAYPLPHAGLKEIIGDNVLVATAPLTNIAGQISLDPNFAKSLRQLTVMGGCVYPEPVHQRIGNYRRAGTNGYAEYNFACDPEAAKIVFSAGIRDITLIGLNVTRSVLYGTSVEKKLEKIGNKCALAAMQILSAVGSEDIEDYASLRTHPHDPVRAMHDVIAMACLDRPDLFTFETLPLQLVAGPAPAPAGQTLIDTIYPDHSAVKVATHIDSAGFLDQLVDNISRLP